jgi:biotin/methionine sulfoxide reductase
MANWIRGASRPRIKSRGASPSCSIRKTPPNAGLKDGDILRVFNDRGACLGGLRLDPGLMRGVAMMATGAWYDPLEPGVPGSICVHGNPNVLTADVGTSKLGQGPSAQSCLIEVEKWTAPLPPVRVHLPPVIEEAP